MKQITAPSLGLLDSRYLKLDQTTPQTVINDFPRFGAGIGIVGNYGLYWRDVEDANTIAHISYDGDLTIRTVGGASDIILNSGSGNIDAGTNNITTTGTVSAEQLTSTNDAWIHRYLEIGNSIGPSGILIHARGGENRLVLSSYDDERSEIYSAAQLNFISSVNEKCQSGLLLTIRTIPMACLLKA